MGWATKDEFRRDARQTPLTPAGTADSASANTARARTSPARAKSETAKSPTASGIPEEWQAIVHEAAWAAMKHGPSSGARSSGTCSISPVTSATRAACSGRNDKGLVTSRPQDQEGRVLFLQGQLVGRTGALHHQPAVHRTHQRRDRRENLFQREAKWNCWSTALRWANEDNATNGVFVWKNVKLKPGENQIDARPSGMEKI